MMPRSRGTQAEAGGCGALRTPLPTTPTPYPRSRPPRTTGMHPARIISVSRAELGVSLQVVIAPTTAG